MIHRRPHLVVMGVSGSGKSTFGAAIATAMDLPFVDADDLHPTSNKALMRRGIPLTDAERWPWLALVGGRLASSPAGVVVACSALRRSYRDVLRSADPSIVFIYLSGTAEFVAGRMAGRGHEFMPDSLLASQYAALEPPEADEAHIEVDLRRPVREVVKELAMRLSTPEWE